MRETFTCPNFREVTLVPERQKFNGSKRIIRGVLLLPLNFCGAETQGTRVGMPILHSCS